jgi:7 transmembrane sweet-taste receptor of 3 GCPR
MRRRLFSTNDDDHDCQEDVNIVDESIISNIRTRSTRRRQQQCHKLFSIFCYSTLVKQLLFYNTTNNVVNASAGLLQRPCNNDTDCQKFHSTSTCLLTTKTCSNPYYNGGCLATWKRRQHDIQQNQQQQAMTMKNDTSSVNGTSSNSSTSNVEGNLHKLLSYEYMRVCSSVDDTLLDSDVKQQQQQKNKNCISPSLWNYTEIRLSGNNWESVFFETWIVQIVLSELLHVPTSVDTGMFDKVMDFYDPYNRVEYGKGYDWDGLRLARNVSDCRTVIQSNNNNLITNNESSTYQSCAHVSLEAWEGQLQNLQLLQDDDVVQKPSALGVLGNGGWYIPQFTGKKDPTLLTYLGMQGEANRKKLADTFLRPTKWIDYCTQVSLTNCTIPDNVTQRPPATEKEESMMFLQGQYTGYFRATDENDCGTVENPKNCTGHIVDYPCGWSSFIQQQTYHLNIALASSGDEPVCRGYTYDQMLQIWQAANATQSHIVMLYWTPEALFETFAGTDSEFIKVSLPRPTQQCFDNRVSTLDRCNPSNITKRIGSSNLGVCDDQPQILLKVITKNLIDITNNPNVPNAIHSPAYDLIRNFEITALQLGVIFDKWIKGHTGTIENNNAIDHNIDHRLDAREAVCEWVIDNMDYIQSILPISYPRIFVNGESFNQETSFYVALVIAVLALVFLLCVIGYVYKIRKRRAIVAAQVEFLFLILLGFLLVLIGTIALAVPPTDVACSFATWLIQIGYTIELASLVVKVAAINRLMTAARQLRRVKLNRVQLLLTVASVSLLMISFLTAWTIIDPVRKGSEHELTNVVNDNNEIIVKVFSYCHNNSSWALAALATRSLMLLCATVLAFQTRNCPTKINESRTLAFMVYSQFSFLVWSIVLFFLQGTINSTHIARYQSIVNSVDVVIACCIYCVPKMTLTDEYFNQMIMKECIGQSGTLSRGGNFNGGSTNGFDDNSNMFSSTMNVFGTGTGTGNTAAIYAKQQQQLRDQKEQQQQLQNPDKQNDTSLASSIVKRNTTTITENDYCDREQQQQQHLHDSDDVTYNTKTSESEQCTDSNHFSLPSRIEEETVSDDEEMIEFERMTDFHSDTEELSNDNNAQQQNDSSYNNLANVKMSKDTSNVISSEDMVTVQSIKQNVVTIESLNDGPKTVSGKDVTTTTTNVILPPRKERSMNRLSLLLKPPSLRSSIINVPIVVQQQPQSIQQQTQQSAASTSTSASISAFVSWFRKDKDGNVTCSVTYLDETGRTKEMVLTNKTTTKDMENIKRPLLSTVPDSIDDDNDVVDVDGEDDNDKNLQLFQEKEEQLQKQEEYKQESGTTVPIFGKNEKEEQNQTTTAT